MEQCQCTPVRHKKNFFFAGRHLDRVILQVFNHLVKWLDSESGAELYTLAELHSKMTEFSD